MPLTLTQKLIKEAAQVVFKPSVLSLSSYQNAAAEVEKEYEEMAKKDETYVLFTQKEYKALLLNNRSVTYVEESHSDKPVKGEGVEKASTAFNSYKDKLSVTEVQRVGYGVVHVYETDKSKEELAQLILQKCYSQDPKFMEISAESPPKEIIFMMDGQKSGVKNHTEIGPTDKNQSLAKFNSVFPNQVTQVQLGDKNLYIAIDGFDDQNKDPNKVKELIENAKKESQRIVEAFKQYLSA